MHCHALMKQDVAYARDTSLVAEAGRAMRGRNVGFLPVCDEERTVVGTVTDRDLVVRALAVSLSPDTTPVGYLMTHEVVCCSPDDDLSVAEGLMMRFQKSRIVCTDAQRHLAGVISLSDIAKTDAQGHAGTVAALIASREADPPTVRSGERSVQCSQIMRRELECCLEDQLVPEIAALMLDRNVGFIPVCNAAGAVVGALTDRDLVLRVIAEGLSPEKTRASDILSAELVVCSPEDALTKAEALMTAHRKSRIVCTDRFRRPVGIISLSDIARVEPSLAIAKVLSQIATRPALPRA